MPCDIIHSPKYMYEYEWPHRSTTGCHRNSSRRKFLEVFAKMIFPDRSNKNYCYTEDNTEQNKAKETPEERVIINFTKDGFRFNKEDPK